MFTEFVRGVIEGRRRRVYVRGCVREKNRKTTWDFLLIIVYYFHGGDTHCPSNVMVLSQHRQLAQLRTSFMQMVRSAFQITCPGQKEFSHSSASPPEQWAAHSSVISYITDCFVCLLWSCADSGASPLVYLNCRQSYCCWKTVSGLTCGAR